MEKALVVSLLEQTYLKTVSSDEKDKQLLPIGWDDISLDDKIILLDQAIASNSIITNNIEEHEIKNML